MMTEADLPRVEWALSYPVLDPRLCAKPRCRWPWLALELVTLMLFSPIGIALYFWSGT
jgi:hypothetical protein